MLPIITPNIFMGCNHFTLNMIHNRESLNLFSDASMRKLKKYEQGNIMAGCYGSVAVNGDRIIEELYRENTFSTVPAAELRGIRCSLQLAIKYRPYFRVFNIFSDSLYSVHAIRDYYMDWRWNQNKECFTYNKMHHKSKKPIENQELIFECMQLVSEIKKTNLINIIHMKGHIISQEDLVPAMDALKTCNGYHGLVSYSVMRYISSYNNYIDNRTRDIVHRININKEYCDPLIFKPRPDIYLK